MPLRCAVLLIPIVLYFCNLPNPSFGSMAKGYLEKAGAAEGLENAGFIATGQKSDEVLELSFNELTRLAKEENLKPASVKTELTKLTDANLVRITDGEHYEIV